MALTACSKTKVEPATPSTAAEPPQVSHAPAAPPPGQPPTALPVTNLSQLQIGESLVKEKKGRPTETPTTDQVLAALETAGVKLTQRKQFLGAMVGAHFCEGGSDTRGLGVSVCEFDTTKAAADGRTKSLHDFAKLLPNREIYVNKKTMVVFTYTPATKTDLPQLKDAFSKL